MSQAIAKSNVSEMPQHSLIVKMATAYGLEQGKFLATLKGTVFPSSGSATNEQVAAFLVVANKYSLDPFTREIYAFPAKGGGITPIVSIDGWLTLINRQDDLDGIEFEDTIDEGGKLAAVTAKIFRKSRSHPTEVTEYMAECYRNTEPWNKYPARMLRHKALIQAARYAFGFAGISDPDEAERIAESENGNGTAQAMAQKTHERIEELRQQIVPQEMAAEPEYIDVDPIENDVPQEPASDDISQVLDSDTEDLRAHLQDLFNGLDKSQQKNLLVGRTSLGKMSLAELEAFRPVIEKVIDEQ